MACLSVAGLHAVARMSTSTARSRRPFETTRATLHDTREPSALAGFFSRRVKPHALRHTEQSIWMDQTRRQGRALGDTRTPRRWAMTPSNESIPSEGEAFRQAYVPRSESPEVRNAERWINMGAALVCSECETTETSTWYANRDDAGKPVCAVCYSRQLAASHGKCSGCGKDGANTSRLTRSKLKKGAWYCKPCSKREVMDIAAAAGTTCVTCGTDTTNQWHDCKDESGNKICRSCYEKNLLDVAAAAGTTCVKCGTDTTSQWHNCKDKSGTKLCKPCYNKNQLDVAAAAGTTCGTDTTLSWYNCKDEPGTKICMSCYKQNQLDVAAAAGTTCVKCGTDTTSQWHNCKDKPGTKICRSCYGKNEGKNKKAGKANEE